MTTEAEWRAAVLADPGDETLKCAYADWLEENGAAPSLVEYHRAQVAHEGTDAARKRALRRHAAERLAAAAGAGVRWRFGGRLLGVPERARGEELTRSRSGRFRGTDLAVVLDRGWVREIDFADVRRFVRCAGALFSREPVLCVRVWREPLVLSRPWPRFIWRGRDDHVPGAIPGDLFCLLEGGEDAGMRDPCAVAYACEMEAEAALSAACLRYGRRQAGVTAPVAAT